MNGTQLGCVHASAALVSPRLGDELRPLLPQGGTAPDYDLELAADLLAESEADPGLDVRPGVLGRGELRSVSDQELKLPRPAGLPSPAAGSPRGSDGVDLP